MPSKLKRHWMIGFLISSVFSILTSCLVSANAQEARDLLAQALRRSSSITPELSIKDRVQRYEEVLSTIGKIQSDFSSSDIGLKLSSEERFGDFDLKKIRVAYLNDAFSMYDKICETSPSMKCIGFVSMKRGMDLCKNSSNFEAIREGHKSLLNAIKIFKAEQKASEDFKMGALFSLYSSCSADSGRYSSELSSDYFRSLLVTELLSQKDMSRARGVVERMTTPFYKFKSVLEIRRATNNPFDDAYVDRLRKFVDENTGAIPVTDEAILMRLALGNATLQSDSSKYTRITADPSDQTSDRFLNWANAWWSYAPRAGSNNNCDDVVKSEVFEGTVQFWLSGQKLLERRQSSSQTMASMAQYRSPLEVLNPLVNIGADTKLKNYFAGCLNRYDIALEAIFRLLFSGKQQEALSYYRAFVDGNISQNRLDLIELYLSLLGDNYVPTLVEKGNQQNKDIPGMQRLSKNFFYDELTGSMRGKEGYFALFKHRVNQNKICDAVKIMFTQVKGTEFFPHAVSYFVRKMDFTRGGVNACGDEDLELMLK